MWSVDHELDKWFDKIKVQRDEKYGTNHESAPMMENQYAQRMREAR
jgi:hypothetical protein